MKLFTQVNTSNPSKGKEYIITAAINQVATDDREGPYYWLQEVNKGKAKRIKTANFTDGKWVHNSEVSEA